MYYMPETRSETLVLRVKPTLRERIKADAQQQSVSESQIVRGILARHYEDERR